MADRHTRLKVRLRADQQDWLAEQSQRTGRPFAEVLAEAIAEYRERTERADSLLSHSG